MNECFLLLIKKKFIYFQNLFFETIKYLYFDEPMSIPFHRLFDGCVYYYLCHINRTQQNNNNNNNRNRYPTQQKSQLNNNRPMNNNYRNSNRYRNYNQNQNHYKWPFFNDIG